MFRLSEAINEHLQGVKSSFLNSKMHLTWKNNLYKDWGRALIDKDNLIAFDNEPQSVNFSIYEYNELYSKEKITAEIIKIIPANLVGIHPDIIQYILEHITQHKGFAHLGEDTLTAYFLNKGITASDRNLKRRLDFICNLDGSVTVVERFQLKVTNTFDRESGLGKPYTSNKDVSLIGIVKSTIQHSEISKVEHTLDSTQIFLLDENLDNQGEIQLLDDNFDRKDANVSRNYNNKAEDIEHILDREIANLVAMNFETAYKNLQQASQIKPNDSEIQKAIKIAGKEMLYYTQLAKKENMVPKRELHVLAKFVNDTAELIKEPTDDKLTKFRTDIKESIGGKYRRWGKLVGGAMLVVFGLIVLAAAITLLATTFGAATPFSGMIAAVAGSIMIKGVAIGTAAMLGTGGITYAAWGGTMFGVGYKENIAGSAKDVLKLSRKGKNII